MTTVWLDFRAPQLKLGPADVRFTSVLVVREEDTTFHPGKTIIASV